jgi:D-inositol-3-phosphate glycosyltransferase
MKPRVALVTHDFGRSGGVATMTRFLYRVLSESGRFEPEIVSLAMSASDSASVRLRSPATWTKGLQQTEGSREGLPFIHVGAFFSELEFQRYRPRALLTGMLNTYDLIQFVVGTPPWICTAAQVKRPKFLWTATMVRPDRANRFQQTRSLRRLWLSAMTRVAEKYERRGLRMAANVFALSDYTLSGIRRVLGPDAGQIAPSGVDTEMFRPAPAPGNRYILCVGRLDDPRKNIALLVKAYARLRRDFQNVPELWLVGPQPSPRTLDLIREFGLTHSVRLPGARKTAELPELYQSALFFVLSSDEEGLGIVLLEAMACGLPVVSTACGGPESVVEHERTGLLVPMGDAEALAAAMARLLTTPSLRAKMGEAARMAVLERFSVVAAGRVFLEKYEEMLLNAENRKPNAITRTTGVR